MRHFNVSVGLFSVCLVVYACIVPTTKAAAKETQNTRIEFSRDVLPILSEKCFVCHGPDVSSRQADMRLDIFEGAIERAIVPGKPDESLLVRRITSSDAPMPPVSSGKSLTDSERSILIEWIRSGAEYKSHWAFVPLPETVSIPRVNTDWMRNEIDSFVLAKLNEQGLHPSKEASKTRWLRRITLDVTGLSPTVGEVDDFLSDTRDDAYERALDRLFVSPGYGERMAVMWLDSARYADSYGYQSDLMSPVWPYRDWVVRAFNKNMRYDEFLRDQIAGDLLPNATSDQKLATAFNRLHRMTNEGGSIALEYKTEYAADRVETMGTAILGLTVGCARCHDHKYDPIKQKDYYKLFAYFNSIGERGLYNSQNVVPSPTLLLPNELQRSKLSDARAVWQTSKERLRMAEISAMEKVKARQPLEALIIPAPENSIEVELDSEADGKYLSKDNQSVYGQGFVGLKSVAAHSGKGVVFDGDSGLAIRGLPLVDRWSAFTWIFWIKDTEQSPEESMILHRTGGTDSGFAGFDLMLAGGRLRARGYRDWPGNALSVLSESVVPQGKWCEIAWSYDGSGEANGLRLYINGNPIKTIIEYDDIKKRFMASGDLGNSGGDWAFGSRFRDRGFRGGQLDSIEYYFDALSPYEIAQSDKITNRNAQKETYLISVDHEYIAARQAVSLAHQKFVEVEEEVMEVPVMQESIKREPAYLLARGNYDAPRTHDTEVSRGVPSFLLPMPTGVSDDRRGLVDWLVQRNHPMTSRVFVNRIWQSMFGFGIVRTPENFGTLSEQPTHPELLDFLARDFVNSDWDIKRLIKKIALSATYRQDSALTPELKNIDPENRHLARGPSHRMDSESLRDSALFAAGLLNTSIGGPPVNPYQPAGLWTEYNAFSPQFVQSKGQDLYRKSLYSTWKRTAPAPNMLVLDSVGREACVVRRARTNTPMQALVLLNDTQFVEAARGLAERVLSESRDIDTCITLAYRRLTAERPSMRQLSVLTRLYKDQYGMFRSQLSDAILLIDIGDSEPSASLRASELAAMTITVQAIMNSDAFVWKR